MQINFVALPSECGDGFAQPPNIYAFFAKSRRFFPLGGCGSSAIRPGTELVTYLPLLNFALTEQIVKPPLGVVITKSDDLAVLVVDDSHWLNVERSPQMLTQEHN